jgi:hypothetical protein
VLGSTACVYWSAAVARARSCWHCTATAAAETRLADAREHGLWGPMESRGSARGARAADAGCFVGLSPHGRMGSTACMPGFLHPAQDVMLALSRCLLVTLLQCILLAVAILVFVLLLNEASCVKQRPQPLRPKLQCLSA